MYIEGRSQPSKGQFFFAYRIRITNNSDRPVQLLRRHWIITDANGKIEHVWLGFPSSRFPLFMLSMIFIDMLLLFHITKGHKIHLSFLELNSIFFFCSQGDWCHR